MRSRLLCAAVVVAVSSGLLVFCVGDDQNIDKDSSTNDAQGTDAPPAQGFTINLAPSHVTVDPGDSNIAVTINVLRAQGFADDVSFTITPPAHVTATNAVDTGNGGSSSSFSISVDGTAPLGDTTLTVTASNPTKTFVQNATVGIHVGTLVDLGDAGAFTVPSWATSLSIKAWGAGGGATCQSCPSGGSSGVVPGGGGGFASGTVAVTPGSQLVIASGTGGAAGFSTGTDGGCPNKFTGSGGGGFAGVQVQGGSFLVIAGGGGGTSYYTGTGGGGGGGASGESANVFNDGGCIATGGSQTAGGTSGVCGNMGEAGAPLQGGNGYNTCSSPVAAGGIPGGGSGGIGTLFGSGGGGGGFFGGGGGGELVSNNVGGAGGGGSGHVASDAGTLVTASGPTPASTSDPDFAHCASGTGAGGVTQVNNGLGGAGCIVIRYTKP